MERRRSAGRASVVLVAMIGAALNLGACGGGSDDEEAPPTTVDVPSSLATGASPTSAAGPLTLRAALSGDAEVPGPGDAAGSGSATVTVDPGRNQVCFELSVAGIAPADKAHVHRGPPDQAGPVVVNLTPPAEGTAGGCVEASEGVVRQIVANPGAFYVNVHNRPFPAGALRGQLAA